MIVLRLGKTNNSQRSSPGDTAMTCFWEEWQGGQLLRRLSQVVRHIIESNVLNYYYWGPENF
jgi:hypothetical protein